MKTIELSGVIKFECEDECNDWNKIKLIQSDGYKIDLVNRFKEADESFPNAEFQVNYWLSDKPCSKNDMIEGFLKKLYGDISADYEKVHCYYTSWSTGDKYDTILQIGGHNLGSELSDEEGKFLIIEINVKDAPLI